MSLQIPPDQILYKKIVGRLGDKQILQIGTVGGLNLIILVKATPETLGVASHPAIARYIAKKRETDIEWTELSKSEQADYEHFKDLLPEYEELTERVRDLEKNGK